MTAKKLKKGMSRKEFLKLPIEERRKILERQVAKLRDEQAMQDKGMME